MSRETFVPSGRNAAFKTASRWLKFKQQDDAIGAGLWRIHDGLYDLKPFIHKHPGGAEWILMTDGHDITEAFEAAHVRGSHVEAILKKYFVKHIGTPRNSPYTFKKDGFYQVLKSRAEKVLYSSGGPGPTWRTYLLQDSIAALFLALLIAAAVKNSLILACVSGLVLGMTTSAAHNFFHQADHWRMHYWDLSMVSSRDWRISHMLSHHMYTNTYNDVEISGLEPFLAFLPDPSKNWVQKYLSHFYIQLIYLIVFPEEYVKKAYQILVSGEEKLRPENLLPLAELLIIYALSGEPLSRSLLLWLIMHAFSGYWLASTSLIASHHHPDIYHAGDFPRQDTDWGLRQIDATRDVTGKANSFFFVATTFGHHTLHHLFPTVDHSKLHLLYPVLEQTCSEFGVSYVTKSQWNMLAGMHSQLMRTESKCNYLK